MSQDEMRQQFEDWWSQPQQEELRKSCAAGWGLFIWEAATAVANKHRPGGSGWIEWGGGKCPLPEGTLVDVRYRDGAELNGLSAGGIVSDSRDASWLYWHNAGFKNDIVAFRIIGSEE